MGQVTPIAQKESLMRRSHLSLAAIALAVSLSACSGGDDAASTESAAADPAAASSSNAAASQSAEAGEASAKASAAEEGGQPVFGDTHTWDDGLAITISEPEEFTPSEYAAGAEAGGTPLLFDVTVKNGTEEPVDALNVNLQSSSGGAVDEGIFDTEAGVDVPTVAIQPGKSLSWKVAFAVNDPADQVIDVSSMHDFTAETVYFSAN